ncbi:MAG: hypothetical protein IKO61_08160 [Lachnospiraceae bacterium]|nr:hypothetical protein [Lachnospiraceae bacterium]
MKDEIEERVEERVEKEREEVITDNIKSLMDSLGLTKDQAMDALNIPQEKRQVFIVNLKG